MRWQMATLFACAVACGAPARSRPMARVAPAAHVAPWLRADPRRCLIPRDLSEGMEDMARRCAETFVRENGYTEEPAEDSTRWVREWEDGGPWPRVLASRAGMLASNASTAQCSMRECIVLFRVRRPVLLCAYRAVRMTQVFTQIRLAQGGIRDVRCQERQA